ncbi:MAG: hypothetical protein AWU57_2310 [Marinobacter sp. T13-3]|nr:MAG: hypothetical protein AWU57_2310 [Marinobacter sp. T13-3]
MFQGYLVTEKKSRLAVDLSLLGESQRVGLSGNRYEHFHVPLSQAILGLRNSRKGPPAGSGTIVKPHPCILFIAVRATGEHEQHASG